MPKILLTLTFLATAAFAQYKNSPAGAPPSELAPAIAKTMQKTGAKIANGSGAVVSEVWFVSKAPSGPKSTEDAVTLPTIPVGALLGVIRLPVRGADRRGQQLKPGVYTLRYVQMPVNGDHQGASPQRDFVALIPAADDKDPKTLASLDEVVKMSRKASGTPHPAVLSIASGSGTSSFTKEGEHDWTLNTKIGDLPVAIILVGKAEG